ncbi:MAG: RIP metalloprotease [Alphaproteobacteria bacterium]|nr:RIP metalloprotease [Alphaproteobacteria bacterium]
MPELLQSIQSLLITLASFVVVLSVVVFVHEFGHFQVARWRGVAIDTFSIGFGKTLFGWRDKKGVQWKIGALPLGGYVKFADDADAMSTAPREKIEDPAILAEARKKGLFHAQPLSTRSMVVAAGPITNFIFSIFAFATLAFAFGRDATPMDQVPARIASVTADSAAQRAGLQPNDIVRSVNGADVSSFSAFQTIIIASPNQQLSLQVERNGSLIPITATPTLSTGQAGGPPAGRGVLGVLPLVLKSERVIERIGVIESIALGASNTWAIVAQTGSYIGGVFTGRESGNQIAGPLGIINVSGQVANGALSGGDADTTLGDRLSFLALSLLNLAAVLSVAVGIVNLLPIPILDGGHLLFYAIEGVRGGKPLPPSAQEWAYRAGFAVMASLFLFATWNDITRLFPGAQ